MASQHETRRFLPGARLFLGGHSPNTYRFISVDRDNQTLEKNEKPNNSQAYDEGSIPFTRSVTWHRWAASDAR